MDEAVGQGRFLKWESNDDGYDDNGDEMCTDVGYLQSRINRIC